MGAMVSIHHDFRVRICVRLFFQNYPKQVKMGKSVVLEDVFISISC